MIHVNYHLDLLHKEPEKRLSIKEVLEHPWIQKYHKTNLPEIRKKSNNIGSLFKMYTTCEETINSNRNISNNHQD